MSVCAYVFGGVGLESVPLLIPFVGNWGIDKERGDQFRVMYLTLLM